MIALPYEISKIFYWKILGAYIHFNKYRAKSPESLHNSKKEKDFFLLFGKVKEGGLNVINLTLNIFHLTYYQRTLERIHIKKKKKYTVLFIGYNLFT